MTALMKEVLGLAVGEFVMAILTLLAVLVALFIGVQTLRQSAILQKREYKARLLDEIKKWALDLQNVKVPNAPTVNDVMTTATTGVLGEKAITEIAKAEVEYKTARVLFEGSYIANLAERVFKKELSQTFRRVDIEIATESYLKSKQTGILYPVRPAHRELIQNLEDNMAGGNKTPEQLLDEHSVMFTMLVAELLQKIAEVKAKLL